MRYLTGWCGNGSVACTLCPLQHCMFLHSPRLPLPLSSVRPISACDAISRGAQCGMRVESQDATHAHQSGHLTIIGLPPLLQ